jgi:hypothetical protein
MKAVIFERNTEIQKVSSQKGIKKYLIPQLFDLLNIFLLIALENSEIMILYYRFLHLIGF